MKRARRRGLLLVVALFGGLVYFAVPCACVTLVQFSHDVLTHEIGRAFDAQQAFYEHLGRYAQTVAKLKYIPDSEINLEIETTSQSSIVIRSTFLMMPEATCSLVVRPDTTSLSGLTCTR